MDNYNYDSYCGIYCGACDIMMSYKTGHKFRLASFWDEHTVKTFQKKIGLEYHENKPFTYKCHGCKSDTLFVNCAVCQIRKCAITIGVEHCIDCKKYPCNLINDARRMESFLPHIKSNHINMLSISKFGINQWLLEQEKKWKCPDCNTNFPWYAKKCKNCSKDLKEYSFQFSNLKSLIMKAGIYIFLRKQKQFS
jgi:hypothetical protein